MVKQKVTYKIGLNSKEATTGFDMLNEKALRVGASFAAYAGILGGVGTLLNESIDISVKNSEAQAKLESVVTATGQAMSFNIPLINQYGKEISIMSGYTRDQVTNATAMLTSFNLTDEAVAELMPSMADMSAFMKQDLNASALQIGKAMTGGASALSRIGITLSEAEKQSLNAASGFDRASQLAAILQKNVGGAAQKINDAGLGFENLELAVQDVLIPLGDVTRVAIAFWAEKATVYINKFTEGWQEMIRILEMGEVSESRELIEKNQKLILQTNERIKLLREGQATSALTNVLAKEFGIKQGANINNEEFINKLITKRKILLDQINTASGKAITKSQDNFDAGDFGGGKTDPKDPNSVNNTKVKAKAMVDEFGFAIKTIEQIEEDSFFLRIQNEEEEAAAILRINKEKADGIWLINDERVQKEAREREQNRLIMQEEKEFGLELERSAAEERSKILQIEKAEERRLQDIAKQEADQRRQYAEGQAQQSAGIAIGIAQQLANDVATGQEHAAERALAATLIQYGGQLVGMGTKAAFEGGIMIAGGNPQGIAMLAAGGAAIAAGVGMGAAGAAVNASISGAGAATASTGQAGGTISSAGTSTQINGTGGNSTGQETTVINNYGSILGDPSGVISPFKAALKKHDKYALRSV